ncbi:hypothetical protein BTL47_02515 [Bordetella holmesii]|nr:hypothetical protein BTL46_02520 [Bordetella holmesii]AUL49797.1 hypothetical protein BTL47_02515 [Bordetella holmesii]
MPRMIPVSLPGGNFYVTMGLSLVCLATLLTWGATLVRSLDARLWLADHRRIGALLMALLAGVGAIFPYQQLSNWVEGQREARAEAARRTVLEQARDLAGVHMPAGTQLRLRTAGQPDSFDQAIFPAPTPVVGIKAAQLVRHFDADGTATSWSIGLAGDASVSGWTCSRGHRVEFRVDHNTPQFASCHLASGNELDAQKLPTGTWLQSTPEGWLLRTDGSEAFRVDGLDLLKTDVRLAPDRRRIGFEGLLAHESARGEMTYPAGTRVTLAGTHVPGAQPGDLLFSPSRGRSARRSGGSDVAAGQSVLQAPDGLVRAVLDNRAAGVLDVASMRVGP